jgi:hypothetical protein
MQVRAPNLFTVIGILTAFLIPFLSGARGLLLVVLVLVLLYPSAAAVGFLLSIFIKPVFVVNRPREPHPSYRKKEAINTLFSNQKPK